MSGRIEQNPSISPLVEGHRLTYSTRWSRLDGNVLLSDEFRGLSPGAQAVYGYLGLFINHESRSWQLCLQLLADYSGYSKRHVRRCVAELEAAGLLARRTVFWKSQAGARQSANVYTLTTPPSQRVGEGQLALLPELPEAATAEAEPEVAPPPPAEALAPTWDEVTEEETRPLEPPPSAPPAEVAPSAPATQTAADEPDAHGVGGGGRTRMSGGEDKDVRPYTEKENSPDKTPSESCPPTPRTSRGAPKADQGQVQVILQRYAQRGDDWWALAARGDVGVVAEVLGLLRLLRRQGGPVSCRKRHIRPSLVAAFQQLEDARAQQRAEAEALQAEQDAELARCVEDAELAQQAEAERRAEAERQADAVRRQRTEQAEGFAQQLEAIAEDLGAFANPLPECPAPSMADARRLPPDQRAELIRYILRNQTAGRMRDLARQLRQCPLDVEQHRRAQRLIDQHPRAPQQEAA